VYNQLEVHRKCILINARLYKSNHGM
jgi:hypothetical protein